jgi:uncharacterized protein (DUF2126 family)
VLSELRERGYAFDRRWFDAHFEFRFPFVGSIAEQAWSSSVRRALEPWHVLPEENDGGGTARAVDSSLERSRSRCEARCRAALLACKRRAVPLHPTGTQGEAVAGVRFRAWRMPVVAAPDHPRSTRRSSSRCSTWTGGPLGGCTVYVSHPGWPRLRHLPVNAMEAESRRGGYFRPFGHAHGCVDPARLTPSRQPRLPADAGFAPDGA